MILDTHLQGKFNFQLRPQQRVLHKILLYFQIMKSTTCIPKTFLLGKGFTFHFETNMCNCLSFCKNTLLVLPLLSWQERRIRHSDRFRTRENTFLTNIEDNVFRTLYEAKEYAHKKHNFALKWDMGKLKITHWRENDNLVQYLIDNLATKSPSWAMRVEILLWS